MLGQLLVSCGRSHRYCQEGIQQQDLHPRHFILILAIASQHSSLGIHIQFAEFHKIIYLDINFRRLWCIVIVSLLSLHSAFFFFPWAYNMMTFKVCIVFHVEIKWQSCLGTGDTTSQLNCRLHAWRGWSRKFVNNAKDLVTQILVIRFLTSI